MVLKLLKLFTVQIIYQTKAPETSIGDVISEFIDGFRTFNIIPSHVFDPTDID